MSAPLAAQETHDQALALQDRVAIASKLFADVQMYFGHWQGIPQFDLDAEYGRYLGKVLATDSRLAFDLASMEFLAKLQNGHSGFGDEWLRQTRGRQLHFFARPIDGQWIVTQSELPEIHIGDVLVALDGKPFDSFYREQRRFVSASDERWRERSLFEYPYLFPESFELALGNGNRVQVRRHGPFQWAGSQAVGIDVTRHQAVPVLRIPAFTPAQLELDAIEALKQEGLRSAPAIIIDLRGNHGGSTPEQLTAALMDRPYRWWSESTRVHLGAVDLRQSPGGWTELRWGAGVEQPSGALFSGKLILLVDGGCFSACEDFVVAFQDNHRATLIGERTAGSSGQPYWHGFENGMGFGLGAKREFMPDGSAFEGLGIAPDIEVHISAADLASGRDPALERALNLAKSASMR